MNLLTFLGDVEELEIQEKPALKVFKSITVVQEPGMVVLEVRPSHCLTSGRASFSKHVCEQSDLVTGIPDEERVHRPNPR